MVPELDSEEQLKWYKAFEETIKSATEDDEITTRFVYTIRLCFHLS